MAFSAPLCSSSSPRSVHERSETPALLPRSGFALRCVPLSANATDDIPELGPGETVPFSPSLSCCSPGRPCPCGSASFRRRQRGVVLRERRCLPEGRGQRERERASFEMKRLIYLFVLFPLSPPCHVRFGRGGGGGGPGGGGWRAGCRKRKLLSERVAERNINILSRVPPPTATRPTHTLAAPADGSVTWTPRSKMRSAKVSEATTETEPVD